MNGIGVFDYNGTIRAYESIRYNDGKGTVESMSRTMYDSEGVAVKTTNYTYTYGDPLLGQMPDVLYSLGTGSRTYSFTYDDLGRLTGRSVSTDGNDIYEAYTYAQHDLYDSYTTPLVETFRDFTGKTHTYTYDSNGNITSDTVNGQTVRYQYDNLNRLVRYNDPVYNSTFVYVYDNRGNIVELQDYSYNTGNLGNPRSVVEYEYTDSNWADLMTSWWGEDIYYDELGNPENWIDGQTLTWENGRQLVEYTLDSSKQIKYTYNADGLRTGKTVIEGNTENNTEYYIVNGTYLGEVTKINGKEYRITYFYDENASPAGIYLYDGVDEYVYYFAKNIQGDVTALVNIYGTVVARYRYDAYGDIYSITDENGAYVTAKDHIARLNPFRYRGYMYDEESGFYYLRSRYYDPYVGRFLNADGYVSTGQDFDGHNMYVYCGNNPTIRMDMSGGFWTGLIDEALHKGDEYFISLGYDTAAIGASLLDMYESGDGVYHAKFDCWQQCAGYNEFYDFVFNLGTSMVAAQFSFSYDGCDYTIWAWKGDYINLGVGAELGIYRGSSGHRTVDTNLAMSMAMIVSYKNNRVICHFPEEYQWWITGFNSNYKNVNANDISVRIGIGFDNLDLYFAFKSKWAADPRWSFFDPAGLAVLEF